MTLKLRASPSQIMAFRSCQVRWRLRWLDGVEEPTTRALLDGQAVHAAIEARLGHGTGEVVHNPAHDAIAAAMLEAAKAAGIPLDDSLVEVPIEWRPSIEGVLVTGRIDLVFRGGVVDWKTRSSLKWAPDSVALASDVQAIVYCSALVQAGGFRPPLTFAHVNGTTRGEIQTSVVDTLITADRLADGQAAIIDTLEQMLDVVDEPSSALPNFDSCSAYGGCPHRDRCATRPDWPHKELVVSSTLEDRLAARRGSVNPPERPAPPVPPPAQTSLLGVDKPTRRPGTVAAANAALTPPVIEDLPQPVAVRPASPTPCVPTNRAPLSGSVLLLGCMPLVGLDGAVLAERWLAPIAAGVAERHGLPHYGLAEYGRGKAELVGAVAELVRRGELPRVLVLDRRLPICEAVVDVLLPAFDVVVGRVG